MLLKFEKLNHNVEIIINDEPRVVLSSDNETKSKYSYNIESFKIDNEELIEENKFYYYDFLYKNNKDFKEPVFALEMKYLLAEKVSKILLGKIVKPLALILPKEIEEVFNGELKEKGLNLIKIKEEELDKEIKRLDRLVTDDTIVVISSNTTYGYTIEIQGVHKNSYIIKGIYLTLDLYKKIPSKYKETKDVFERFITQTHWGDYTVTTYYSMTYKDLLECIQVIKNSIQRYNKIVNEQEQQKQNELNNLTAKAKETGQKQKVKSWHEECNDRNDECNIDIITQYIDEYGKFSYSRQHTW